MLERFRKELKSPVGPGEVVFAIVLLTSMLSVGLYNEAYVPIFLAAGVGFYALLGLLALLLRYGMRYPTSRRLILIVVTPLMKVFFAKRIEEHLQRKRAERRRGL